MFPLFLLIASVFLFLKIDEKCRCSPLSVVKVIAKVLGVFLLLYIFICTLDLLSNAFRLLGGKTAGKTSVQVFFFFFFFSGGSSTWAFSNL